MGNVNAFPVRAPSNDLIPVPFRVKLDGANDGVVQEGGAFISSVKHAAAGRYTIVLKHKFMEFVGASFTVGCDTAEDLVPQVRAPFDSKAAAGATMTVSLLAAAVETDPPAFAAHATYLFGTLWVRNTGNPS